MPETHLLMHLVAFAGALWWTKSWLIDRPASRWRYILASLSGIPLWIVAGYTATRAADASSGVVVIYESLPIAYFSFLMAFVSAVGFILGLYLWAEEEGEETAAELRGGLRTGPGD